MSEEEKKIKANDILSMGNQQARTDGEQVHKEPDLPEGMNEVVASRLERDAQVGQNNSDLVDIRKLREVIHKINDSFSRIENILNIQSEKIKRNTDAIMTFERRLSHIENKLGPSSGGQFSI